MSIVETTEEATMNMMQLKYVPRSGTASDVAGIVSATIFRNTVSDSRIVTPVKWKSYKNFTPRFLQLFTENETK